MEQAELGLPYSFRAGTHERQGARRALEPLSNGGYVLSYSDITLRKRAEKDLIRNRDELERTVRERTAEIAARQQRLKEPLQQEKTINAMQRQFLTMTSHEFRTRLPSSMVLPSAFSARRARSGRLFSRTRHNRSARPSRAWWN